MRIFLSNGKKIRFDLSRLAILLRGSALNKYILWRNMERS